MAMCSTAEIGSDMRRGWWWGGGEQQQSHGEAVPKPLVNQIWEVGVKCVDHDPNFQSGCLIDTFFLSRFVLYPRIKHTLLLMVPTLRVLAFLS